MQVNSRVITLPFGRGVTGPGDNSRDEYVARLKEICMELSEVAERFQENPRSVLADLTYIVVGEDIVKTISLMDD